MKYQSQVRTSTKVLIAALVVVALGAVVRVTSHASFEATLSKKDEFEAAWAVQMAVHERKNGGSSLAAAGK